MEKIKQAVEISGDVSQDVAGQDSAENELRTLKDLEMVLVGGGSDGVPCW